MISLSITVILDVLKEQIGQLITTLSPEKDVSSVLHHGNYQNARRNIIVLTTRACRRDLLRLNSVAFEKKTI